MADAGVPVDEQRAVVQLFRLIGEGNQGRLVTQAAGVKDGADLAHHVLTLQVFQAGYDLILVNFQLLAQLQVGPVHHGKLALDEVKQLAIGQVHTLAVILR